MQDDPESILDAGVSRRCTSPPTLCSLGGATTLRVFALADRTTRAGVADTRVIQFDVDRAPQLRASLEAAGFAFRAVPHAIFGARGEGISLTLYKTGRLVVQGKDVASRLDAILPSGASEPGAKPCDAGGLVGTDESGKGDYFGPLVVAAVRASADESAMLERIGAADSKILSDSVIRGLDMEIRASLPHAVVAIDPPEYNALHAKLGNLNLILGWAHAQAIADLIARAPCDRALTDQFGNPKYVQDQLDSRGITIGLEQRPRAEEVPAVAAASILARAEFVRRLEALSETAGMTLPKGASDIVDDAARRLVRARGRDFLGRVAKLHFKTTLRVTGLFG
jgi:ribonuclease HIII